MSTIADVLEGRARWCVVEGDNAEILPTLPAGCADAIVTDPPYAISNQGLWHIGRPGKGKRRFDFFEGDADWQGMTDSVVVCARETLRVLKSKGSSYWWCGHREFGPLIDLFENEAKLKTRFLGWVKPAPPPPAPGSGWPSALELCVYAFPPGRTWNHKGTNPPPSNALVCDSYRHGQPGKVDHPTQKPLEVLEPLLLASTLKDDLVIDPYNGSGSTGAACIRLGRRYIGVERDPKYAALARERLAAESQGLSLSAARAGQLSLLGGAK